MWSVVVDIHPSIIADYNFRGFLATPDYGIRGGIPNYVIRGMTRFGLTDGVDEVFGDSTTPTS